MLRIFFLIVILDFTALVSLAQKNTHKQNAQVEDLAESPPLITTENVVESLAAFPPYEQVLAQLFASLPDEQLPHPDGWVLDRHPEGWRLRDRENRVFWIWRKDNKTYVEGLTLPLQQPDPPADFRREAYAAWTTPERAAPYTLRVFVGYPAANRHTAQWLPLPGEWPPPLLQALGLAHLDEARRMLRRETALQNQSPLPPDSVDAAEAHLRQAVDAYRRLNGSNPEYAALEGRPVLALDLALAESGLLLQQAGHAGRGKTFLEQLRFSPFYLSYGRNLLLGLPDSAVLYCPDRLERLLLSVIQQRDPLRPDVPIMEAVAIDSPRASDRPLVLAPVPDSVQGSWVPEGLFARWTPSPESGQPGGQAALGRSRLYTDVFRFPALSASLNRDPTAVRIAHRYRRSALQAARELAAVGQPDEGLRLLNVLYRHLPEWVIPMQLPDLAVIGYYYAYGSPERAGEMGMALGKLLAESAASDAAAARALSTLKTLAQEHDQSELLLYYERLGP